MTATETTTEGATRPYLGLATYTERDVDRFYGRVQETRELERLVRRSHLTVLFGASGLGKSSLLRAGLFPALRDELFPIPIRLNFTDETRPILGSLRDVIAEQAALHHVDVQHPDASTGKTLSELFSNTFCWSEQHELLVPLLVIDQFEELFTIGERQRKGAVRALVSELVQLADPRDRRAESEDGQRSTLTAPRPRIILSLREDFLAQLEDLKSAIPAIVRNRYRLRPMTGRQALDAVVLPAHGQVSAEVAESIVRFVADPAAQASDVPPEDLQVEPALLSMVCDELDQRRNDAELPEITEKLALGERQQIVEQFYERSFRDLAEGERLRFLVEDALVTDDGFRTTIATRTAKQRYGVTTAGIEELERRRLVRVELRFTVPHVELIHDLVTKVAAAGRAKRMERRALKRWGTRVSVTVAVLVLGIGGAGYGLARRHAGAQFRTILTDQGQQALLRDEVTTAAQLLNSAREFSSLSAARDRTADIMLGRAVALLGGVDQTVQHVPGVACVRLRNDGGLLTCGSDGTARVWNLDNKPGPSLPVPRFDDGTRPPLLQLLPSHKGDWVLAIDADGNGTVVDAKHAAPPAVRPAEERTAWMGCISPDDRGFAIWSPGAEDTLRVWSVGDSLSPREVVLADTPPALADAACLDEGAVLAATVNGAVVRLSSAPMQELPGRNAAHVAEHVAASEDGKLVVAAWHDHGAGNHADGDRRSRGRGFYVWRDNKIETFAGPSHVDKLAIAGSLLLVTEHRSRAPAEPEAPLPSQTRSSSTAALRPAPSSQVPSPDVVIEPSDDVALITVWDLSTKNGPSLVFSVERHAADALLTQDGHALAIGSSHQIELWDTTKWTPLLTQPVAWRSGTPQLDVAPGKSDEYTVAIVDGPVARVFKSGTTRPARPTWAPWRTGGTMERHAGRAPELFGPWPVHSHAAEVVFSPDGKQAAVSRSSGRSFDWVWSLETGDGIPLPTPAVQPDSSTRTSERQSGEQDSEPDAPDKETLGAWLHNGSLVVAQGRRICRKSTRLPAVWASCIGAIDARNVPEILVAHPTKLQVLVVQETGSADWISFEGPTPTMTMAVLPRPASGKAPVGVSFSGAQDQLRLVVAWDDGNVIVASDDGTSPPSAANQLAAAPPAVAAIKLPGITSVRGSTSGRIVIAHGGGVEIGELASSSWQHVDTGAADDAVVIDTGATPRLWACDRAGCTIWDATINNEIMLGAVKTYMRKPRLSSDARFVSTGDQLLLLPVPPRAAAPVLRDSPVSAGAVAADGTVIAQNRAGQTELATPDGLWKLPPTGGALAGPSFGLDGKTLVVPSGHVIKLGPRAGELHDAAWTGTGPIAALAWNHERDQLVAVDTELATAILDPASGAPVNQTTHANVATCLQGSQPPSGSLAVFDPSGERFAVLVTTGTNASEIEVHQTDTTQLLHRYRVNRTLQKIELAGDTVLGVTKEGLLIVWTHPDTLPEAVPETLGKSFTDARLAPGGAHLVALADGNAWIWTLPGLALALPPVPADSFDIDNTGKRLLVSMEGKPGQKGKPDQKARIEVRALDETVNTKTINHWDEKETKPLFAPNGRYVLAPRAHLLHAVDSTRPPVDNTVTLRLPGKASAYAFGGDSSYVVMLEARGVRLYRPLEKKLPAERYQNLGSALSPGPSAPDGRSSVRLATQDGDTLWIFDGKRGSRKLALPPDEQQQLGKTIDVVWSLAKNGKVTQWDVPTGYGTVRETNSAIAAALGTHAARVVVESPTGALTLVELSTRTGAKPTCRPMESKKLTDRIEVAAIDPTARWFMGWLADGTVQVRDLDAADAEPRPLTQPASHARPSAIAVAMSSDGPVAAIGRSDGVVEIWRVDKQVLEPPQPGHSGQILSAAFDPTGSWLATASSDGTIRVWDTATGECVTKLTPRPDHAAATLVAFGPGATAKLLSANQTGDLFVWELFPPVPSREAIDQLIQRWLPLGVASP